MKYLKKKAFNNIENKVQEESEAYSVEASQFNISKKAKKLVKKSPIEYTPGECFGDRYQIIKEIGRGTTGRVYLALDKKMNKVVALKLFNPDLSSKRWSIIAETVKNEWQQAKDMHPERLSKLYDIGEISNIKYISMRYIPRGGLKKFQFKKLLLIVSTALLFIIAFIVYLTIIKSDGSQSILAPSANKSIVVLPFKDLSTAQDQEYFCDGVTEAIIYKLSQLKELKVISMNSIRRNSDTEKDIKEICNNLGVDIILAGTVQKNDRTIRVRVSLINANDDTYIWSNTYEQKLENVFTIQDKAAESIANALQVELLPDSFANNKTGEPKNTEAWEYYLKGMHFINRKYSISHKEEDFETAVNMFARATQIEPEYALAYWGLGMAYESRYVLTKNTKDLELMLKSCEEAYQLKPNLAETHLAMGWVNFYKGDIDRAYQSFKSAYKANPNSPLVNFHIGSFLNSIGLKSAATTYYLRATMHDPLFIWNYILLSDCFMNIGKYGKAAIYINKGLEIEPDNFQLHLINIKYFVFTNKYSEAEKVLSKAEKLKPDSPHLNSYKALVIAAKGEREESLKLIKDGPQYSYVATSVYSLLGMEDKAIKYITKGINSGFEFEMAYLYPHSFLINNPCYDNLRNNPQFKKILKRQKTAHEDKSKKYGNLY
jgi:TolB-like protein/Tfp pilus assembly protein PilF